MTGRLQKRTMLTYEEYQLFPNDGHRHEIVDGEHFMNPAPSTYHQTISRRIQFQLYQQIEEPGLGEVFDAPTDLQLSPTDIVQPDLLVMLSSQRRFITPAKIVGAPALVVEIISPSTAPVDRVLKRSLYQRAGVAEYWIVSADDQKVEQYRCDNGSLELVKECTAKIEFEHPELHTTVIVDLSRVW